MGRKLDTETVDLGLLKAYQQYLPQGCPLKVGKLHWIGKREEQQDSFGMSDWNTDKGMLFVLCDGMGGMDDGAACSAAAVIYCLSFFDNMDGGMEESAMERMAMGANDSVVDLLHERGSVGGSTLVAACIDDHTMHWCTVGDSRLYLYRGKKLSKLNEEHNYALELAEKVANGEITEEEAQNDPQRKALISYLGLGDGLLVDHGSTGLNKGDRILLSSDGVFGTLSHDILEESMEFPVDKAMMNLETKLVQAGKSTQDNSTAICIEVL